MSDCRGSPHSRFASRQWQKAITPPPDLAMQRRPAGVSPTRALHQEEKNREDLGERLWD